MCLILKYFDVKFLWNIDNARKLALDSAGYEVYIIWQHDINHNALAVEEFINELD